MLNGHFKSYLELFCDTFFLDLKEKKNGISRPNVNDLQNFCNNMSFIIGFKIHNAIVASKPILLFRGS